MRGTTVRNRLAVAACGLGIAGSLACSATPVFALTGTDETEVSIVANDETNLKFEAPAELPFAVNAEGKLIGPDPEHLQIKNLSTFGIHIVNVKTEPRDYLNLVSDVSAAEHAKTEDLIDFQFGPADSMIDASEAATETGLDTQYDLAFNMSQMEGGETHHLAAIPRGYRALERRHLQQGDGRLHHLDRGRGKREDRINHGRMGRCGKKGADRVGASRDRPHRDRCRYRACRRAETIHR